jgi:hypothetical protein
MLKQFIRCCLISLTISFEFFTSMLNAMSRIKAMTNNPQDDCSTCHNTFVCVVQMLNIH